MYESAKERKRTRDQEREAARLLKIEWKDKLWMCQRFPADDTVIAWLCENRSEASKIGLYQWNYEVLPQLIETQTKLRNPESFQSFLDRTAEVQHATANIPQFPQFPQDQPKKRRARSDKGVRQSSRKSN